MENLLYIRVYIVEYNKSVRRMKGELETGWPKNDIKKESRE